MHQWKVVPRPFQEFQCAPDLSELRRACEPLGCISFRLPSDGITAGKVLHHCIAVLESLFGSQSPLIFKLGFCQNPHLRWTNRVYGYSRDPAKWEKMIVMYASKEPFSPGMLEAALIDKYGSNPVAHGKCWHLFHCQNFPPSFWFWWFPHYVVTAKSPQASQDAATSGQGATLSRPHVRPQAVQSS